MENKDDDDSRGNVIADIITLRWNRYKRQYIINTHHTDEFDHSKSVKPTYQEIPQQIAQYKLKIIFIINKQLNIPINLPYCYHCK